MGGRMAQARRFNGMTQVHAATACGVPPRTYQNWERDEREPTISGLKGLARATGFPIMYFIGDDGDAKTPTPPDGGVPSGGVDTLRPADRTR